MLFPITKIERAFLGSVSNFFCAVFRSIYVSFRRKLIEFDFEKHLQSEKPLTNSSTLQEPEKKCWKLFDRIDKLNIKLVNSPLMAEQRLRGNRIKINRVENKSFEILGVYLKIRAIEFGKLTFQA